MHVCFDLFKHCIEALKFIFSKQATKIDEIFPVYLTVTTYCQIDGEDIVNFCGLLRKRTLYKLQLIAQDLVEKRQDDIENS